MRVSELEEEIQDLDWFALDEEGTIGHFATGGCGALPRSIASSREDLQKVTLYFRNHTAIASPVVSHSIDSYISLKDNESKARYLRDFLKMSSQGLFSFDCMRARKRPTGYFQVARPSVALYATALPLEIRQILERTVLEGVCFRSAGEIAVEVVQ
jgi:hypothetical protein